MPNENQVITFSRIDENTVLKTIVETTTKTENITVADLENRKIQMQTAIQSNLDQIKLFEAEIENIDAEMVEILAV